METVKNRADAPPIRDEASAPAAGRSFRQWWRETELNPVLVKEIRQAVRNRAVLTGVNILLSMLLGISLFVLFKADPASARPDALGSGLFFFCFWILTLAAVLIVPLYVGAQLAGELHDQSFELMLITTLGAHRILRGKTCTGLCLAALAFSLCLPFMAMSTLMRGVDLPSVLFVLFWTVLAVGAAIQAAILVACIQCHWLFKSFFGVLLFGALLVLSTALSIFSRMMLWSGVTSLLTDLGAWFGFVMVAFLTMCGIGFLHVMSIAFVVRDTRPRGYYNELIRTQPVESV